MLFRSGVLLLLQQWYILLYQSISQSDNTITCLVSALLNLTDEVVIGFRLTSYNDISPVKNKKESSHLAISDTVSLTLILSSVQFRPSVVSNSLRLHGLQHAGFPYHQKLPEPSQNHVQRVSDAIQPSHPLSSPSPPAFNPSHIRVFSNESVLRIR